MKRGKLPNYLITKVLVITSFYLKIPRRIRILIVFFLVILLAYFIIRFLGVETQSIPPDFLKARGQASLIAAQIVSISDESAKRIDEIAKLDEEQKYTEALLAVSKELERNREARDRAVELSAQLETMARNLAQISPISFGQKALEAVSSETALISRLITYNDYLTQLLDVLRGKFLNRGDGNQVPELIQKINDEARAINDLNQKFNDVMKEFDSQ